MLATVGNSSLPNSMEERGGRGEGGRAREIPKQRIHHHYHCHYLLEVLVAGFEKMTCPCFHCYHYPLGADRCPAVRV